MLKLTKYQIVKQNVCSGWIVGCPGKGGRCIKKHRPAQPAQGPQAARPFQARPKL